MLLLGVILSFSVRALPLPAKPNVLVVIVDDIGVGDLGFTGAKDIPTPNLDRLAKEGVIFQSGYVMPMCAPTRAAFLTGRNPAKIGFEDNRPGDSQHYGLDLALPTVADVMRGAGYTTSLIGKWHVGKGLHHEYSPWNRGFEEFWGYYGAFGTFTNPKLTRPPGTEAEVPGYSTDLFTDAAIDYINKHKDKPFFLNVAYNAAHLVQVAKPEDLERFAHITDPKRRMAAAIIANLDQNIGRLLAQLHKLALDQNTLVIFFSDNGGEPPILGTQNGPLRGMKFDVYEGGIRVPFCARWNGTLPAGKKVEAPVSVMDVLPTMAAAAGAKLPANVDGVNLLPYLLGQTKQAPHETLFWRTTQHAALQKMRQQPKGGPPVYIPHLAAVREGDWKLVVLDDAGKNPQTELYDLSKDLGEKNNLAEKKPKVTARLLNELADWRQTLTPQKIPPPPKPKP